MQNEQKVPMMLIELTDQRSSGFIKDGTQGTAAQEELRAPSVRFIPNVGKRQVIKKDVVDGKEVETSYNEEIRFIKNEAVISKKMQEQLGITPSPISTEDKIPIEKGTAMVFRDGATIGLYDFLHDAYYNEGAIGRSAKATVLYRVVEIDKKAEEELENTMLGVEATTYIGNLFTKKATGYEYDEEKINGLCQILNILGGETPATKLRGLVAHAKMYPKLFLESVYNWEGTTGEEITLALNLNLIKFEDHVWMYTNKNTIIMNMGTGFKKATREDKIKKLANYLRTRDGHEAYLELKAEIKTAQNNALNK